MDDQCTGARPTLRVLAECLNGPEGWDDPEQHRAVRENRFKDAGPLAELKHRIIQDGRELQADPASADGLKAYKSSLKLSGRPLPWRQLRSGQWRALVAQAEEWEHWWIVNAGLRREGDASNVYQKTDAASVDGLEALYPDEDDLALLRLEQSAAQLQRWQQACAMTTLDVLGRALESGAESATEMPRHPSRMGVTAQITFDVTRLDPDDLAAEGIKSEDAEADIFLTLQLSGDWNDSVVRASLLNLIRGLLDPVEEHWQTIGDVQRGLMMLLATNESRLTQIKAAVGLADRDFVPALGGTVAPQPQRPSVIYAHFAPKDALADAYVYGEPCHALCGQSFVPSRDPSPLPVCPACQRLYEGLATG
jgi:hypothetical protein